MTEDEINLKRCTTFESHEPHDWFQIGQAPDGAGPGRYECPGSDTDMFGRHDSSGGAR